MDGWWVRKDPQDLIDFHMKPLLIFAQYKQHGEGFDRDNDRFHVDEEGRVVATINGEVAVFSGEEDPRDWVAKFYPVYARMPSEDE